MSAIYILWLRELKRYVRSKAQMVASLAQPLLYLVALGFGFGPVFAKSGNGDYRQFISPGIISMSILFTSVFSGIAMLWDRQFGFLKETLVAPVPRIHIMLGRTLGGATVAVIQATLVFVACLIVGFRPAHWELIPLAYLFMMLIVGFRPAHWELIPLAYFFMMLIALVFASLGTAIGSVLQDMQGFQLIMNFLVLPIYFLSGALYPLKDQKLGMMIVTRLDPLSYGVDALRNILSGIPNFHLATDLALLSATAVLFLGLGAWLFSRIQL